MQLMLTLQDKLSWNFSCEVDVFCSTVLQQDPTQKIQVQGRSQGEGFPQHLENLEKKPRAFPVVEILRN